MSCNLLHLSSFFIRYHVFVGNARTCIVSFVDSEGIRHSIEVAAESLYEAAALAVREFRRHPWTDGMEPGAMTHLAVSVKSPAITHEVTIRQLERWAGGGAKSPREILLKSRVRELLDAKPGSAG